MMLSKPVLATLLLTLVLTIYVATDDDGSTAPSTGPAKAGGSAKAQVGGTRQDQSKTANVTDGAPGKPTASAPTANTELTASDATSSPSAPVDLFPIQTWVVAPPPPPPPPPATAPPLPFTVDIVWQDAGGRYVILGFREQQVVICERCSVLGNAKPGEVVFEQYRLEAIQSDQLVFTYLPLNERQTLRL